MSPSPMSYGTVEARGIEPRSSAYYFVKELRACTFYRLAVTSCSDGPLMSGPLIQLPVWFTAVRTDRTRLQPYAAIRTGMNFSRGTNASTLASALASVVCSCWSTLRSRSPLLVSYRCRNLSPPFTKELLHSSCLNLPCSVTEQTVMLAPSRPCHVMPTGLGSTHRLLIGDARTDDLLAHSSTTVI